MDTDSVVRDMDTIRASLGEQRIGYLPGKDGGVGIGTSDGL